MPMCGLISMAVPAAHPPIGTVNTGSAFHPPFSILGATRSVQVGALEHPSPRAIELREFLIQLLHKGDVRLSVSAIVHGRSNARFIQGGEKHAMLVLVFNRLSLFSTGPF